MWMSSNTIIGYISVSKECNLTGKINSTKSLVGHLPYHPQKIIGTLSPNGQIITGSVTFARSIPDKYYEGQYEVVPAIESQVLETKQTYLSDDVTVTSIPYFDVSNNAGGSTVYIGSHVELK